MERLYAILYIYNKIPTENRSWTSERQNEETKGWYIFFYAKAYAEHNGLNSNGFSRQWDRPHKYATRDRWIFMEFYIYIYKIYIHTRISRILFSSLSRSNCRIKYTVHSCCPRFSMLLLHKRARTVEGKREKIYNRRA